MFTEQRRIVWTHNRIIVLMLSLSFDISARHNVIDFETVNLSLMCFVIDICVHVDFDLVDTTNNNGKLTTTTQHIDTQNKLNCSRKRQASIRDSA